MDISDWRKKIDRVDAEILELLNKRARFSLQIGELKKAKNLPVYCPERETEILARMAQANPGPLTTEGVRRVFERIIDESRKLEKDEVLKTKQKE